ncbi:integrin beta-PS-like isoform X1 [Bactrocera tryoni]|uniref:integrin beta-PS-like isoform X1 n=2 Tax=Bactrocera tryoni TaxID=59916 RepID=UPI001A98A0F9|nr:integrin beta-PS-like isoform X1 [Bactrocera tryoni]
MSSHWRYGEFLLVILVVGAVALKNTTGVDKMNPCKNKDTCRECIQTANCAWCKEPNFAEDRCFPSNAYTTCKSIENPETKITGELKRPLSSGGKSKNSHENGEIVQLMPQYIKLELRPNEMELIKVKYARALDYPVDLYYLMDLSESMKDDKDNLSKLGNTLAETMRNLTSDFRLGFGSFTDKAIMPFADNLSRSNTTDLFPRGTKYKCHANNNCLSYRNIMALSRDTDQFSYKVKNATTAGNYDSPEGGLEAMMQAIVCRKEIGWREKARHLLVFSTDANFHTAGDGRLAGLIQPNDGKCHLDEDGYYTHAEKFDYPSIGQVKHTIEENAINVIFAVTHIVLDIYKTLSANINGSSYANLEGNSGNVVNLIREQYQQISSSIQMRDNATSDVKITYYSACRSAGPKVLTSKCDGLHVGDEVTFSINIRLISCPKDEHDWRQIIQIYPVGINESLIIDLKMLCGCECDAEVKTKSQYCSSQGNLVCGVCQCEDQFVGAKCQCSNTDMQESSDSSHNCRDNTTIMDCSGRGICSCGQCQCDKRNNEEEVIWGKYCQCDNFSCERYKQRLCSGPAQGKCECGQCTCNEGYQGKACECSLSTDKCRKEGDDKLCSGKGTCECNVCKCEGPYSGKHCEECPTCSSLCLKLQDCVQCQMYKTGAFKDVKDCAANCTKVKTTPVDKVVEKSELVLAENFCEIRDHDCKYAFTFKENNGIYEVQAQKERECLPKVDMLRILLSVAGSILFIGLATLLLWKLITTIQDNREYRRFEKEQMKAQWNANGNPLYRQATGTFRNPTYLTQ